MKQKPTDYRNRIKALEYVNSADLTAHPGNWREHPAAQAEALKGVLSEVGIAGALLAYRSERQGGALVVIDGHLRKDAAPQAWPVLILDVDDAEADYLLAVVDPLAAMAVADAGALDALLSSVQSGEAAVQQMLAELAEGAGLYPATEGDEPLDGLDEAAARSTLAERFIVPPFSVLDARQGYWQDRKRAWIALGIESELGRGVNLGDVSATVAGITDPEAVAAWNKQRRELPGKAGTLGAIAPNEGGENGILTRTGKYAPTRANATPGGSPRPAATLGANGRTQRGDGKGRPMALAPSATLLRLKPSADQEAKRAKMRNGSSPAQRRGQDLMRGEHVVGENRLTWVAGDRPREELDETSRENLAAGRRTHGSTPPHGATVTQASDGTLEYRQTNGTSIFDPVLCELAYTWFTAPGGHVLDPFAGGSVRGIVASYLGRDYTGIDLRSEQIEANEQQAAAIVLGRSPRWIVGNSLDAIPAEDFDFIFTCPPYYDLEVYSDDPEDLSNKEDYAGFLADYRNIIAQAVARLRDDRFACVVVGDVRDKKGMYRNFVADTIAAFRDTGMALYNEAILVTAVGSLSIRVGKQFSSGRKLGKTHQNVLVFVKGDPRTATAWCGPVEVGLLEGADEVGA
jgi:hypothetical protein